MEGAAILVAVAVVSIVTAVNDYKKESQFIALNKFSDAKNNIKVVRDGEVTEINIDNLKVGDVAVVKNGMDIPCDAILIEGSVSVDESAMTGESDELKKETLETALKKKEEYEEDNEGKVAPDAKEGAKTDHHAVPTPVLLSGTSIVTGGGSKMLITVVGKRSAMGKIKEALSQTGAEMTPL